MEATEIAPAPAQSKRRARTRIKHGRSKLPLALKRLAVATDDGFEPPSLNAAAALTDDEFQALKITIAAAMRGVLSGGADAKPPVPGIDAQMQSFANWQKQHTAYYHWTEAEIETLRAKLIALGPGCELAPCYAISTGVRLAGGKLIFINRRGERVKF
jgi:hypothetical protein